MANKRTITALIQALRGSPSLPVGISLEALAHHLSEAGVLVPAVLTDDQAVAIGADAVGTVPTERTEIALCVREGLEQIAKRSGVLGARNCPSGGVLREYRACLEHL